MYTLRVLGGLDLQGEHGDNGNEVVAQPRRIALLVYLAMTTTSAPLRRDQVLGLFWPELTQHRARNALNKALHLLRDVLGQETIVSRGAEELGIDRSRLWCDAVAFAEAVDAGRMSEALELYRGDLLPAFYIEEAGEFEAWLDRERSRLRSMAARAASALARQRETDGQLTVAVGLARRAVELSDEDERSVRQLLELLDRLGDRAGALYAYDKFARRLATEFGAEPAAETKALLERIRARSEPAPRPVVLEAPRPAPAYTPHSENTLAASLQSRGYAIERELGRGGMATVYLARDLRHDRQVALKVLAPEIGALRLADRFAAEIRVTAQLNHPNILSLFDSGAVDGVLYYVMPYVPGESLRARLDREKQLPVDESVRLVTALAAALEHAHRAGVVHRDIKPENILLHDGRPLLADFGIALALSSAGVERITSTGLSLGTPQYMSPEQAAGELTVGPQSDIYSLAAVAYEMLVGEPPFTGPNTRAVLARVMLEEPRPIRTVRTTVPEHVEAAIMTALAKHPADRFVSVQGFSAAIEADTRFAARQLKWSGTTWRAAVTGAAVTTAIAAVLLAWTGRRTSSTPDTSRSASVSDRFTLAAPDGRKWVLLADFESDSSDRPTADAARTVVASALNQSRSVVLLPAEQLVNPRRGAMLRESEPLVGDAARNVAYRSSAFALVEGRIDRAGSGYSVVLQAINATTGRVTASADSVVDQDNLVSVARRLAQQIATAIPLDSDTTGLAVRRIDVPGGRTRSLEALKRMRGSYEAGRNWNLEMAMRLAREASQLDSTYLAPWTWMAGLYDQEDSARWAYEEALRRAPPAQRADIEMAIAGLRNDPAEELRLTEARLRADPTNAVYLAQRSGVLTALGRHDESLESARRAAQYTAAGNSPARIAHLVLRTAAAGYLDEARALSEQLPSPMRGEAEKAIAIAAADWNRLEDIGVARESDPTIELWQRSTASVSVASAKAARGRVAEAHAAIDRAAQHYTFVKGRRRDLHNNAHFWHLAHLLLDVASGQRVLARVPLTGVDSVPARRIAIGLWRAFLDDTLGARQDLRVARAAIDAPSDPIAEDVKLLEAAIAARGARWNDVVNLLGAGAWQGRPGTYTMGGLNLRRWLVADAYEQLGKLDSAAAYFELLVTPTRIDPDNHQSKGLIYAFAHRRLALLRGVLNHADSARAHWREFVRTFDRPDREFVPLVEEARTAMAASSAAAAPGLAARLREFFRDRVGPSDYQPQRVLVLPFENPGRDPVIDTVAERLLATMPEAIARENVGEPVPAATIRDLIAQSFETPSRRAERLTRATRSGIQVRGSCTRSGKGATCQLDVLRMPARTLRMSIGVSGDPSTQAFANELVERVLVALYFQDTWGDRVNWSGQYLPRSLAAARAFKHACCDGNEIKNAPFYAEAARLDTGWVAAIANAAFDSPEAVAESTFVRLARRPGLLDGERQIVSWLALEHRLQRGESIEPGRLDASALYEIHRKLAAANPEWWSTGLAFMAYVTNQPTAAVTASMYADSAKAPRLPRILPYNIRAWALHHLGRYKDELALAGEIAKRFPNEQLTARTHEIHALAGLGDVAAIRKRLSEWEATPEPSSPLWAGSRGYPAGLELMAHGHEREGREILTAAIPVFRRLKQSEGRRVELREVLIVAGLYEEARRELLDDLANAKLATDSVVVLAMLGAVASRQENSAQAARYWNQVKIMAQRPQPLHKHPGQTALALSLAAGWMNDGETAVRMLEHARAYGVGGINFPQHRFVHRDPVFAGIRNYPPFQNYLKPRD